MPKKTKHTLKFLVNRGRYDDIIKGFQSSGRELRRFKIEARHYFRDTDVLREWAEANKEYDEIARWADMRQVPREGTARRQTYDNALANLQRVTDRMNAAEDAFRADMDANIEQARALGLGQMKSTSQAGRGTRGAGFIRLHWHVADFVDNLIGPEGLTENMRHSALLQMRYAASELRQFMYENAPWQNHTWRAREGLRADVYETRDGITLRLGYSVYYGVYLEFSNEGRFAIITPTLQNRTDEIITRVSNSLLRRYGRNA